MQLRELNDSFNSQSLLCAMLMPDVVLSINYLGVKKKYSQTYWLKTIRFYFSSWIYGSSGWYWFVPGLVGHRRACSYIIHGQLRSHLRTGRSRTVLHIWQFPAWVVVIEPHVSHHLVGWLRLIDMVVARFQKRVKTLKTHWNLGLKQAHCILTHSFCECKSQSQPRLNK